MRRYSQPGSWCSGSSRDASDVDAFTSTPLTVNQPTHTHRNERSQIPGPAGAVQTALRQRDLDHEARRKAISNDEVNVYSVVDTQVYLDKATDHSEEFDADFARPAWVSTLEYFGTANGFAPLTPISAIKTRSSGDKVEQIVAIIKTFVRNGFGGLTLTLKDPTGAIGATVHHKVVSEGEYGSELVAGAVVVLRGVTVFSPNRSARYLNITINNLLKVIHDGGDTSVGECATADQLRN